MNIFTVAFPSPTTHNQISFARITCNCITIERVLVHFVFPKQSWHLYCNLQLPSRARSSSRAWHTLDRAKMISGVPLPVHLIYRWCKRLRRQTLRGLEKADVPVDPHPHKHPLKAPSCDNCPLGLEGGLNRVRSAAVRHQDIRREVVCELLCKVGLVRLPATASILSVRAGPK